MSPDEREFTDEKERDDLKGGEIYIYIYIYIIYIYHIYILYAYTVYTIYINIHIYNYI